MIRFSFWFIVALAIASFACSPSPTDPPSSSGSAASDPGFSLTPGQIDNREHLEEFLGFSLPPPADIDACPGPGAAPAQGWAPGQFPCTLTAECQPGLVCNHNADQSTPNLTPWGSGCGLCQSDLSHCPPSAPWWGHCGGAGEPGCPPYISRALQGGGCTWAGDCSSGSCDYTKPVTGFCGSC